MTLNTIKFLMFSALVAMVAGVFYIGYQYESPFVATIVAVVFLVIGASYISSKLKSIALDYVENYTFPSIVIKKFMMENPQLSNEQVDKVIIALKQFFLMFSLCQLNGNTPKKGFMMPSRIADELWHQFMLDSRNYQDFCDKAFGKMLHHKPGMDTGGNKKMHQMKDFPTELKNTYTCINNLKKYNKLYTIGGVAVLFGIDAYLNIHNGFYYDAEVLYNLQLAITNATATGDTGSSGSCGGLIATDTVGSCGSDSGGSSSSSSSSCSSCGGGCGD